MVYILLIIAALAVYFILLHYHFGNHSYTPPSPSVSIFTQPANKWCTAIEKSDHLKSLYWFSLRLDRLTIANNCCELCHSRTKLEAHHITYNRLLAEDVIDIRMLCRTCHQAQHDHYGYNRDTMYFPLVKA